MHRSILSAVVVASLTAGCDTTTGPAPTRTRATPQLDAVAFWETIASTRWMERANAFLLGRPSVGVAQGVRITTYLSLAQYRAVLAAESQKSGPVHPSVPAAVGAASAAVLSFFYPGDAADLEATLVADLAGPEWPGAKHQDLTAGEAIGRAVGAEVIALAESDGFGLQSPGAPPIGPGFWSSGTPSVASLYGARPFFMSSADQLVSPPPPAFGSADYLSDLAEVRAISDARTPEQLASAQFWNATTAPLGPVYYNQLATDLIRRYHRKEREAARILAYANAAVFDALIACFHTKFAYWFIRPSQADPAITTPIGLPNHPSYPSAHACITDAYLTVLADAFPSREREFARISEVSGLSRVVAGIHYRFDVEAGTAIGRAAGQLALAGNLE